jgi:hypothetical protein
LIVLMIAIAVVAGEVRRKLKKDGALSAAQAR